MLISYPIWWYHVPAAQHYPSASALSTLNLLLHMYGKLLKLKQIVSKVICNEHMALLDTVLVIINHLFWGLLRLGSYLKWNLC